MKKILLAFICSCAITVFAQIPTNGLVEHYTFNNTLIGVNGSNLANVSGPLKGNANFSEDRFGNSSSAQSIDSVAFSFDSIPITNYPASANAARSIAFWFRHINNSTHSFFNYNSYSNNPQQFLSSYALAYENGNIVLAIVNQGAFSTYTTSAPYDNVWTHVVSTFDGDSAKIYINGTLKLSVAASVPQLPNGFGRVGRSPGNSYYGNFEIDDLIIYNRALSTNEIAQLAGVSAPTSISNSEIQSKIMLLYPNPTSNILNIESSEQLESVQVVDLAGRVLMAQTKLTTQNTQLAIDMLEEATYFLQIKTTSGKTTVKSFVKQ